MTVSRVLAVAGLAVSTIVHASDPASHDVTVPIVAGETVVVEWTGTALPGGSGSGNLCPPDGGDDSHTINLTVPDGTDALDLTITADFHIDWTAGTPSPTGLYTDPDLVLSVYDGVIELGSSDGGSPEENVGLSNLPSGTYAAIVCPFNASQPTDYNGKLTLTARANQACPVPLAKAGQQAIAHSLVPSSGAKNPELAGFANFDAYLQDIAASASPVPAGFGNRLQTTLYDRRMGKPTFLWAERNASATAVGPLTGQELLIARARAHLGDEARPLGLTAAMIEDAAVTNAQYNGAGPAVIRFQQRVNGYEVFHRSLNVLLDRSNKPVAVSGYFATDYKAGLVPPSFAVPAPQAIAAAWANLGGSLNPASLSLAETRHGYQLYSGPNPAGSHMFERNPRVKALYYPRAGALEPAYYVELFARARINGQLIAYAFVVSATDGRVLHRENLKSDAAYTYRAFAGTAGPLYQPYDNPLGNGYTPFPGAHPNDNIQRVPADSHLITLNNAGIVTDDPWLPDNAVETIGNHVDACLDSFDNAASGVVSNPANTCDPELGDMRAAPSGDHTFDYAAVADTDPSTPESQSAAVVNIFYMNNWLHDWWYNHGFDEPSGNAQTDNFGRGGADGDPIKAQAQDSSGRNNANMATPSDGSSPTMQQYLFDGPPIGEVRETAPVDSGPLVWAAAAFGPTSYDLTELVTLADDGAGVSPSDGCGEAPPDPAAPTPAAPAQSSLAGRIALIDRGNCNFTAKAQFATSSGAIGMIVVQNTDGEPITMGNGDIPVNAGASPSDPAYQIPSVMIRKADGQSIKDDVAAGDTTAHMQRAPSIDLDGTLDNQIIAHEYFHYVHHRLTASSNGQADAMSEGWGDISAWMLSARADERQLSGNDQYQGAYALATYVANNFWAGIRRAPHSTDFAKNAFTFKHISDGEPTPDGGPGTSNSEVHNAGEIWANAMWECYVGILNRPENRFEQARDKMQDYIIGGFKMTPADATYTEARDAVLAVVLATDSGDYEGCSNGFARRGMGLNAVAPDRSSVDLVGVVESYEPFVAPPVSLPCGVAPSSYSIFAGSLGIGGLLTLLGLGALARRKAGQ